MIKNDTLLHLRASNQWEYYVGYHLKMQFPPDKDYKLISGSKHVCSPCMSYIFVKIDSCLGVA